MCVLKVVYSKILTYLDEIEGSSGSCDVIIGHSDLLSCSATGDAPVEQAGQVWLRFSRVVHSITEVDLRISSNFIWPSLISVSGQLEIDNLSFTVDISMPGISIRRAYNDCNLGGSCALKFWTDFQKKTWQKQQKSICAKIPLIDEFAGNTERCGTSEEKPIAIVGLLSNNGVAESQNSIFVASFETAIIKSRAYRKAISSLISATSATGKVGRLARVLIRLKKIDSNYVILFPSVETQDLRIADGSRRECQFNSIRITGNLNIIRNAAFFVIQKKVFLLGWKIKSQVLFDDYNPLLKHI